MKIRYHGFWNSTGYGYAAMTNVTALKKAGHLVNVHTIGAPESIVPAAQFEGKPEVVIMHLQPHAWPNLRVQGALNVGYTTWEADRIPKEWIPWMSQADQVWVPSQWNKQVFERCGLILPIHVIPHCVKPPLTALKEGDRPYRFYTIATAHVRKNLKGLLAAFKEVVKAYDNVELWVKTSGEEAGNYKYQFESSGVWDKVNWIQDVLSNREIQELHRVCNCFVSLNTGEGFGVPIADAIAHGNEVVTTGYGGHLDFCAGYAKLVDFKLGPVSSVMEEHGFDRSMRDAKADSHHAGQLMKEAYRNRNHLNDERTDFIRQHIQNHSFDRVGKLMTSTLENRSISLNFQDNGIGDMICFLYAYEGFKRLHSAMHVNLLWKKDKREWHQALSKVVRYGSGFGLGKVIDIQLNTEENFTKRINSDKGYRKQYADLLYCEPHVPQLYSETKEVVIFPSAAWANRIWPTDRFGELADRLKEFGYKVTFCDVDNNHTPKGYATQILSPDEVIKLVKRVALVICNESGMAHLAGLVRTPCLCISGFQPKWRAHDMNDVEVIQAAGLKSVSVNMVFNKVVEVLGHPDVDKPVFGIESFTDIEMQSVSNQQNGANGYQKTANTIKEKRIYA